MTVARAATDGRVIKAIPATAAIAAVLTITYAVLERRRRGGMRSVGDRRARSRSIADAIRRAGSRSSARAIVSFRSSGTSGLIDRACGAAVVDIASATAIAALS